MQENSSKETSYTVTREYTGKYTPEQLVRHIIKIHTLRDRVLMEDNHV